MRQRAPEIVDVIRAPQGTDLVEDRHRLGRQLLVAQKRNGPHQTSAMTRAGPPVPPRTLGAPTISVAPAAGIGVETRQALDPVAAARQPGVMRREIRRWPVIERQRVDRDADRLRSAPAASASPRCGSRGNAGPPRAHRHRGSHRCRPCAAQPEFIATQAPSGIGPWAAIQAVEVVGRDLRVAILGRPRADVDHAQRAGQACDRDLVHRLPVGREMQRRVDMGAGVLVDRQLVEVEAVVAMLNCLS